MKSDYQDILKLPQPDPQGAHSHNIYFTKLTNLIKQIRNLKTDQQIQSNDIGKYITKETEVGLLIQSLENFKLANKSDFQPEKFNLYKIFYFMTGKNLLNGILLSLLMNGLNALGILILDEITIFLKDFKGETAQKVEISFLLLAIILNYYLKSIFHTQYQWQGNKWHSKCKASIQYLVYQKALRMKIYSNQQKSNVNSNQNIDKNQEQNQSEDHKNPDINNILTVDVESTLKIYTAFIETISNILTITIIILLIYYKIGGAIVNGLYILLGAFFLNMIVGLLVGVAMEYMYNIKDKRSVLSKDIIEGIKSIKYLSWEQIFQEKIKKIRYLEYKGLVFLKSLDGILTIFWQSLKAVLLFTFLKSYIEDGHDLKDSNIFTIIALFGNLTYPLGMLPHTIEQIAQSKVSYNRIKQFLNQPEIQKEIGNQYFNQQILLKKNQILKVEKNENEYKQHISIHINNSVFLWPSRENIENKNTKSPKRSQIDEEKSSMKTYQEPQFQLKVENLIINQGSLNYVIGKIGSKFILKLFISLTLNKLIGSGKTAFLLSLLNEMDSLLLPKIQKKEFNNKENLNENINDLNNLAFGIQINQLNQPEDKFNNDIIAQNRIIINGQVGYVGQNHWLQSQTVRENILFGKQFDQEWYNQCVSACDLETDFKQFNGGDMKLISADGGNLSGGQRQRVAICRSIYQNKDIYLFDDIFSSLDVHVAHRIHQNIIDLLINKLKKTLILVTSHYGFLKNTLSNARILLMNEGNIVEDSQLIKQYIQQSLSQHDIDNLDKIQQDDLDQNEIIEKDNISTQSHNKAQRTNFLSHPTIPPTTIEKEDEQLDDNEELREKGEIKSQTWKAYANSIGFYIIIPFIVFQMITSASSLFTDFWLRDQVSQEDDKQFSFYFVNRHFSSFEQRFLFLTLLSVFISVLGGITYFVLCLLSSYRIFNKLNNSIMFSKIKFFDKNPIGRILKRLSDDINTIDDVLPMYLQIFLDEFSYAIGYPVAIVVQNPWLIAFVLIALGIAYVIQKMYRESNREMRRLCAVDSGKLLTHISESCRGLILIRSFNKENYMVSSYLEKLSRSINSFLLSESLQIWMNVRLLTICSAIQSFVAITAFIVVLAEISLDYNIIALSLTYSILFTNTFADCILLFCTCEQNFISVERVRQYFDNPQEDLNQINWNQKNKLQEQENILTQQEIEQNYSIIFKSVSISYDDNEEEEGLNSLKEIKNPNQLHYALKNISFFIRKGEKVAFCGRTGSGKTSILNMLFGMYPISKGQVYINNKNINNYTLKNLRNQMSIIPQFGFLYHASFRDNLDPQNKIERSKIQQLINQTNLKLGKSHQGNIRNKEIINLNENNNVNKNTVPSQNQVQITEQQEDDLEFEIEDGGKNLSNGQKQIINFFRIVLRETDIVCLDEATSNMDPTTDAILHEKLFQFTQGKTLIVITHRLENIEHFDRVFVLEKGEIVESGHVSDLKKNKEGFFSKLYNKQL